MCGIAGVVRPESGDDRIAADLERMRPGIASRGPDGHGMLHRSGVGLLNTRLAVIDLETGDQPVWNESRDVACVFNGEIYNFRQLRRDLADNGHELATRGDTEVLVHLYEDHGPDFVHHLHGMYAFALYDLRRRRVVLARDRFGIKPLYVAAVPGGTAFASSIASLLALGVPGDPDEAAIAEYLRFYKVPEPRTAYRAIRALLPGHVRTIEVDRGIEVSTRFYRPAVRDPAQAADGCPAEAETTARYRFREAVASHLVADVEVGAFLSGGIDSSLVVAEAQRQSARPLRTYAFGFSGSSAHDEAPFAAEVARHLGTRHETLELAATPEALVRRALAATQQPFAVASFLPLLELSERAARDVKVVLTGDGGDEVGLGYPWYRWSRLAARLAVRGKANGRLESSLRAVERRVSRRPALGGLRRAVKFTRGAVQGAARASDVWRYDLTADEALALLAPEHREGARRGPPRSPTEAAWTVGVGDVGALRLADLEVLLRDEMLPKLDRAGMAHGLESRVPLLDDRFVDAMLAVPAERHLDHPRGKSLLRSWAGELLPGVDFERPKHGFDVPVQGWLDGSLRSDVERLLLQPGSSSGLIDAGAAHGVVRRMRAGVPGAGHTLYAMLVAALWFEQAGLAG